MCLLFLQKNNKKSLSREEFNSAWQSNPDGFGIYTANKEGTVIINKTKDRELGWQYYEEAINSDYEILIGHFRWGTSGGKAERLIHPFNLNEESYLFHNGIVSISNEPEESDTSTLALFFSRQNTPTETIFSTNFVEIMQKIGGGYNKFIIACGKYFYIINESAGDWVEDSWFSNGTYKVYSSFLRFGEDKKKELPARSTSLIEELGEKRREKTERIEEEKEEKIGLSQEEIDKKWDDYYERLEKDLEDPNFLHNRI